MKLSEYRSQLRFRLQEPQTTGRFSDSELDSFINRAIREVADQLEPLVKTSALSFAGGEAKVPLPSDVLRVHRVSIEGSRLRTTDPLYLDTLAADWEKKEGTPTHAYIEGSDLRLYPIPEDPVEVMVLHSYLPDLLVDDSDESPLPSSLDEGVILYALCLARDADMDERSNNDWAKYQTWLQRAQSRVRHRTISPMLRVRLERSQG